MRGSQTPPSTHHSRRGAPLGSPSCSRCCCRVPQGAPMEEFFSPFWGTVVPGGGCPSLGVPPPQFGGLPPRWGSHLMLSRRLESGLRAAELRSILCSVTSRNTSVTWWGRGQGSAPSWDPPGRTRSQRGATNPPALWSWGGSCSTVGGAREGEDPLGTHWSMVGPPAPTTPWWGPSSTHHPQHPPPHGMTTQHPAPSEGPPSTHAPSTQHHPQHPSASIAP